MSARIERSLASIIRHEFRTSSDAAECTAKATTRAIDYLAGAAVASDAIERVLRGAVRRAGVDFAAGEAIIIGALGSSPAVAAAQAGARASIATIPAAPRISLDAVYVALHLFDTVKADGDAIVECATEAKERLPLLPPLPPPQAAQPAPAPSVRQDGGLRDILKSFAASLGYTDQPHPPAPAATPIPPMPRAAISGSDFIRMKAERFDSATPLSKATIAPLAEAILRTVRQIADVGPGGQTSIDAMKAEVARLSPTTIATGRAMAEILTNRAIGPTFTSLPLGARDAVARGLFAAVLHDFASAEVSDAHAALLKHFLEGMSFEARRDAAKHLEDELFYPNTDQARRTMSDRSRSLLLATIAGGAVCRPLSGDDATLLRMLETSKIVEGKLNQLLDFVAKSEVLSAEATEKILDAIPRNVNWIVRGDDAIRTMNGRLVAYGHGSMWDLRELHADVKIASDALAKTAMTADGDTLMRLHAAARDVFRKSQESDGKARNYLIQVEAMLQGQVDWLAA